MGVNAIMFYMVEEAMDFLGSVRITGNVPCVRCGKGDECTMSGLRLMHGPDATVDSVGINTFEAQPHAMNEAHELGKKIGEALRRGKTGP
jgi:hypothetical protein